MEKTSVLVGMSGGVDSSAAALLLQRQGFRVMDGKLFGKAERQFINGEVCYAYKNDSNERLLLQVEPTDRYLESFRITSLPIELPEDTTQYLPDDATSEAENPLFGDKQIDTSAVTGDKIERGGFKINYRYSVTK